MGYHTFGSMGPSNVIDGMRANRPAGWWALHRPWEIGSQSQSGLTFVFLITTNSILTDAITVRCVIGAIENICPDLFAQSGPALAMRLTLVVFRFAVVALVDNFLVIIRITAALFCVCNNLLYPILAFYSLGIESSKAAKVGHACIFAFGVGVILFGTSDAISDLSSPKPAGPGSDFRLGISAECRAMYDAATALPPPSPVYQRVGNFLRGILIDK
jgi:hypothetical protein